MLSRLGPAPLPLLVALAVVVLALAVAVVPIGRPARTVPWDQAFAMILGAGALAGWAVAVLGSAWGLARVESAAVVLVPPLSPGAADLLFSAPLLVVVPVASLGLGALMRGGRPGLGAVLGAAFTFGLLALREADRTTYVHAGRVEVRVGWLWVRRESVPVDAVRGVEVLRDTHRGAASYNVHLVLDAPERTPRLATTEARFRVEAEAHAEAERWRRALAGQLRGAP